MAQTEEQEEMSQESGLTIGIDYGNSKISAAVWDPKSKQPSMVLTNGKNKILSTLYVTGLPSNREGGDNNPNNIDLRPEVGVKYTSDKNTDYFVYDIKRLIGVKNTNEDLEMLTNNIKYKIDYDANNNIVCFDEKIPFENLLKYLFEKIKKSAEEQFGEKVYACTISVPNGFNSNQRNVVETAAKLAGIKKVYIIHDPLSTAIYYASKNKIQKKQNLLIIDFGSSKLNVTLLEINPKNAIKIKKTGGDSYLGGIIFNNELVNDVLEFYRGEGGNKPQEQDQDYLAKMIKIEQEVKKLKEELTFKQESNIHIEAFDGQKDLNYSLKRENFDELNNAHYNRIMKLINEVVQESGIPPNEIHIILQGDAIRVKTLTNLIKEEYRDSIIIDDLYDAVAEGAAIHVAQKLNMMNNEQFKNFRIYDITPLSLGVRGEGDLMSVIVKRGFRVPIKIQKFYITTQDNQSNIKFEIFAGERKLIKDNIQLDRIILKGLPQMNKGQVRIEVIFEVDENFILHVTAKELTSNITSRCDVVINEDLSQNQILTMIEDAKIHEQEDLVEKERIQSRLRLNDKIFEYSHLYEGNEDILRELESYRNWIKHSSTVSKEEYEKKLKELNDTMLKDKNESKTRKQTANNNIKKTNNKIEEEKNPENK
jgi:molecular chaperone DnaK (HSP70)